MPITLANLVTGRARVYYGGTVIWEPDENGCYWDTTGTDMGCTEGGINITYEPTKTNIYCDQSLPAVDDFITEEVAEVSFTLKELDIDNLERIIENTTQTISATSGCLCVGGDTSYLKVPLKVEVDANDGSGRRFIYTFFRVSSTGGLDVTYGERETEARAEVTFTAFADTTKPAGCQLFSVVELF